MKKNTTDGMSFDENLLAEVRKKFCRIDTAMIPAPAER